MYAFVLNNPVLFFDVLGLLPDDLPPGLAPNPDYWYEDEKKVDGNSGSANITFYDNAGKKHTLGVVKFAIKRAKCDAGGGVWLENIGWKTKPGFSKEWWKEHSAEDALMHTLLDIMGSLDITIKGVKISLWSWDASVKTDTDVFPLIDCKTAGGTPGKQASVRYNFSAEITESFGIVEAGGKKWLDLLPTELKKLIGKKMTSEMGVGRVRVYGPCCPCAEEESSK